MGAFVPYRDSYLNELLRHEGRGDYPFEMCLHCHDAPMHRAVIRCLDCDPQPLRCEGCAIEAHKYGWCHRVQRWTGRAYVVTNLRDLGLRVQLGHADNSPCANPDPARKDFCVVDIHGQHNIALSFCACDQAKKAGSRYEQLLRRRLFPATQTDPNTAFTFRLLEHYHIQSLQGKISMYDYYTTLERQTDNTGSVKLQDRYKAFMRVVAQWRHLKMLKRAGRGHDPTGVDGTREGELAIRCPACPQPDINLPPNWEDASDDLKYLYILTVAMDACFRLKRRDVSNTDKDPILGSGWGYFVEDAAYHALLKDYGDQDEESTCTGLSAIAHANSKFSSGYAATGVGAIICARHEFMLANGLADILKGERYIYMDYIFVCALRYFLRLGKLVTYDIACQWSKHLVERIARFPSHLQIPLPEGSIKYGIPKLHFHSHTSVDHSRFSLNYIPGAARGDGEGSERRWWWIQPTAHSTRVMGPGQRQGILEDQWNYANWRKTCDIGLLLYRRLEKAIQQHAEHEELFNALTSSLEDNNVAAWRAAVEAWEKSPSTAPDPYVVVTTGPTEAETKKTLVAKEQAAAAAAGYVALNEVSMLGFITSGLDVEDLQYRIQCHRVNATLSEVPQVHEQRTVLRRRLQKFRELLAVYMPAATPILLTMPAAQTTTETLEDVILGLPSQIPVESRHATCAEGLVDMEMQLRDAQCRDSLQDLRNQLHVKQRLFTYKKLHVRHQGPNTRARADLAAQEARIRGAAAKYRRARSALLSLRGAGEWETEFRVLADKDIRCVQDDDLEAVQRRRRREKDTGESEGHRVLSWIWRASDRDGDVGMVESLRVEWCKSRARVTRWAEERRLLPEEMRRVLAFLEWQEVHWYVQIGRRSDTGEALEEGLAAYAISQAQARRSMRATFRNMWLTLAHSVGQGIGQEWAAVTDTSSSRTATYQAADSAATDDRHLYELYLESQGQESTEQTVWG
ncbi:hypothetical protein C2E23DRAFT_739298 [Lenzites betulinus]|nr:hypothetical protein C2E23DRAFT_739298 [Lenzites betulinus]